MKCMRYAMTVAAAMAAIILIQMTLTCVFTFHVGEVFSKTAMTALFFFCILRAGRRAKA